MIQKGAVHDLRFPANLSSPTIRGTNDSCERDESVCSQVTVTSCKRNPEQVESNARFEPRKVVVGTIEQFPTKTAAKRAVETSRTTINASNAAVPVTVRELVTHYEEKELPRKAFSTQRTLEASIRIWVLPR